MPLDVEFFYSYWQETWNLIFWITSLKYLIVATKIVVATLRFIFLETHQAGLSKYCIMQRNWTLLDLKPLCVRN